MENELKFWLKKHQMKLISILNSITLITEIFIILSAMPMLHKHIFVLPRNSI